jgi:hypothetical protein
MTVRDSRVAIPKAEAHRRKPPGVLRVLRLALMFTALASSPGFAEDTLDNAWPTVSVNRSTYMASENYRHASHRSSHPNMKGKVILNRSGG